MLRPRDKLLTSAEFADLRAYLARRGVLQTDAVLGTAAGNRTRKQLSDTISTWLRTRPKA